MHRRGEVEWRRGRDPLLDHGLGPILLLAGALLMILGPVPPALAQKAVAFGDFFTGETLRVDYYHWGTATTESLATHRLIVEGEWAGSKTHLTDGPDFGKYRFKVVDPASGGTIFEKGYSTLFGEWQTTEEAKVRTRVFEESLRFPRPRTPIQLQVFVHDKKGKLVKIFEELIDPGTHLVERSVRRSDVEIVELNKGGTSATSLDIVIVADGYPARQKEKALRDLARYSGILLATRPFDRHAGQISIRGVIPTASRIGPGEPRKFLSTEAPAGTTFNTFDSERYLTTVRFFDLMDLAGQVPYDTIYVMVNTTRYGGAGIFNYFSIFVADNQYDEYVFVHEFGHGFAGLADEYYNSAVAYSDFYPAGVEPNEPNITALLEGADKLKWKGAVEPGTPVPTPNEEAWAGKVGAFEGAGYAAKGLFRPALDCKMKSKKQIDFCPVCSKAVEDMIRYYTE
jgi:hypothetical protein